MPANKSWHDYNEYLIEHGHILLSVAKAVAKFDDKDMAMTYVDNLVELVDKMKDDYDKSRFIASIVYAQSKIGLFSDSMENIKKFLLNVISICLISYIK